MRARPFRSAAIVVAVLAMVAPAGHADPITIAPPFTEAYAYDYCDGYLLSSCLSSSEADAETGHLMGSAEIATPQAGAVPWMGYGYAEGAQMRSGRLNRSVPGIEITATLHVDEASASLDTLLGDAIGQLSGVSYVVADVFVYASGCSCYGGGSVLLADETGLSEAGEDVTVSFEVRDYDGGPVLPGDLQLVVYVWGYSQVSWSSLPPVPDAGSASFSYDVTVTSVTGEIVS